MMRGIFVKMERKLRDIQSEGIIARLQINCEKTKSFRINAESDNNSK
jgi:competence protein ComGC